MNISKVKKTTALLLICSLVLNLNTFIFAGTNTDVQVLANTEKTIAPAVSADAIVIDVAFPSGNSVVYNAKKHLPKLIWKGGESVPAAKKNTVCDLSVSINTSLLAYATPLVKVKNNRDVASSDKKRPCMYLKFKASSNATPEQKSTIKTANAGLKNKPVYFEIEKADLNDVKPVVTLNKNSTKVKRVTVTLGDKQVKLGKKDYTATVSGNIYTITGLRNFKGTYTNDNNRKKEDDPTPEDEVDAKDEGIRKTFNGVNLNLLKTADISKDIKDGKNLAISSYSIENALGMTANGAKDETLSEMEAALFDGASIDDFNKDVKAYGDHLKSLEGEGFTTNLVNGIWTNDLEVKDDFCDKVNKYYSASINTLPFNEGTAGEINDFVAENTHDMIKKIVDDLDDDVKVVLVNALYMEGKWEYPFDEKDIKTDQDFVNAKGETEKVTRLVDNYHSKYFSYKGADGIIRDLTEGKGKFIAILPKKGQNVYDYLNSCDEDMMAGIEANIKARYELTTEFPEFEYEYEAKLNDPLSELGMRKAFSGADFSGMLKDEVVGHSLYIDSVIHKTHVKVDRTGAKAAAATAVTDKATTAVDAPPHKYVIFDRPFVYMLTDDNYVPLFIGVVNTCR